MSRDDLQPLLSDKPTVAASCISLLLLCQVGWGLFGLLFGEPERPVYTHLHCSECLEEFSYYPQLEGKTCPSCGSPRSRLVPTTGSRSEGGDTEVDARWGKVFALGLLGVILVQCQFLLTAWRLKVVRRRREANLRRLLTCRCPFCQRKLGYPARKAGTGAVCRHCKTGFVLPDAVAAAVSLGGERN